MIAGSRQWLHRFITTATMAIGTLGAAGLSLRSEVDEGPSVPTCATVAGEDFQWRRTERGWERKELWDSSLKHHPLRPAISHVHPVVTAGLLVLASLVSLIAFDAAGRKRN